MIDYDENYISHYKEGCNSLDIIIFIIIIIGFDKDL